LAVAATEPDESSGSGAFGSRLPQLTIKIADAVKNERISNLEIIDLYI
jgi:hypothetical protein